MLICKRSKCLSILAAFLAFAGGIQAATVGSDNAANYTSWEDASSEGTGFDAWGLTTWLEFAGHFIGTSTNSGSGVNIDTDGKAFGMYANPPESNSYANAYRSFAGGALEPGQTFSIQLGVNYWAGNKGIDLMDSNGTRIFNLNFGDNSGGAKIEYGVGANTQTNLLGWDNNGNGYIYTLTFTCLEDLSTMFRIDRSDSSYFENTADLGGVPAQFHLYTGGTDSSPQSDFFFNNLSITEEPSLTVSAPHGMALGNTNTLAVFRRGPTNDALEVSLSCSKDGILNLGASLVTIPAGSNSANVEIVAAGRGEVEILATADTLLDSAVIYVYALAYDDSANYGGASWTNESNGGTGFFPWVMSGNEDSDETYTNHCGNFIGSSTSDGGGNVDSHLGTAFGIYANKEGEGGLAPEFGAVRQFNPLAVGEGIGLDLGVNYRNGAKGVVFQDQDKWLFEIAVVDNKYVYQNHGIGGLQQDLNWEYEANTAIEVILIRKQDNKYDIVIERSSSTDDSLRWVNVEIGGTPDRARFYVYNTESGGANNLYFNHLGIDAMDLLALSGVANVEVGATSQVTVARSGSTNTALTVSLAAGSQVTIPASVEIPAGESEVAFEVVGVTEGIVVIEASAEDAWPDFKFMNSMVFSNEFDNAGNYVTETFTNGANEGLGFDAWIVEEPEGAEVCLADSTRTSGSINSMHGLSFSLLGGTNGSYAGMSRALIEHLSPGDTFECALAMNWSGGHRGVDIRSVVGDGLFNFNLNSDVYSYTFLGQQGVDLGWPYDADAVVEVRVTQLSGGTLEVSLSRNDGLSTNVVSPADLGQVGMVHFYNGDNDGSAEQTLYVNNLLVTRSTSDETDGIPNSWWDLYGIPVIDRTSAGDADSDGATNAEEFMAGTDPSDPDSVYNNEIAEVSSSGNVLTLQAGPPTSAERLYDAWWTTNLVSGEWTPCGLNVPGAADGSAITLSVTNTGSAACYRTGIKIMEQD